MTSMCLAQNRHMTAIYTNSWHNFWRLFTKRDHVTRMVLFCHTFEHQIWKDSGETVNLKYCTMILDTLIKIFSRFGLLISWLDTRKVFLGCFCGNLKLLVSHLDGLGWGSKAVLQLIFFVNGPKISENGNGATETQTQTETQTHRFNFLPSKYARVVIGKLKCCRQEY